MSYSRSKISQGLSLLLHCPWATTATEQAHAMGALIKRMHHEIGSPNLCSRAMVGGFRKLLPLQTQEEKEVQKLQKEFVALEQKNPSKIHARQAFLADCMRITMHKGRDTPREGTLL